MPGREWRQWVGCRVIVVDAKSQAMLRHVGRTGRIRHLDDEFGERYDLVFDDGGRSDAADGLIIEPVATSSAIGGNAP